MNDTDTKNPDAVERLLAEHLDRQSARIDATPLHERIKATLAAEALPSPVSIHRRTLAWARWAGGIAVAACLLVGGIIFWQGDQPLRASPQALLQETQKTLLQPIYRCYLVDLQRETNLTDDSNPMVAQSRQTRLWTRGDRFWMETTFPNASTRHHYWGRDEQGTIWMMAGAREGIVFHASETPAWLTMYGDLCSMQPDRLIAEVLRDFDLRREDPPAGSSVHTIKADLKPGRGHALKSALLELDAETKVLRRIVLHRETAGTRLTTTFTLVETKSQDEIEYPLDSMEGKREFFSTDYRPEERKRLLSNIFGPRAHEWIKALKK